MLSGEYQRGYSHTALRLQVAFFTAGERGRELVCVCVLTLQLTNFIGNATSVSG